MFIEIRYTVYDITYYCWDHCVHETLFSQFHENRHHSIKFHVMTTLGSIPLDNQRPLGQCSDRGHRAQDLGGGVFP